MTDTLIQANSATPAATVVEKVALETYVPPAKPSLVGMSRAELVEGLGTIGVAPAIGRHFTDDESDAEARIAVISHHLWQSQFGGRADILGQTLEIDGGDRTIVGVLPPGYRYPYEADIWWPRAIRPSQRSFVVYARMRSDVSLDRVNDELTAMGPRLNQIDPAAMRGMR